MSPSIYTGVSKALHTLHVAKMPEPASATASSYVTHLARDRSHRISIV